jgi:nucleoside-diphosphate-sugar epimerase
MSKLMKRALILGASGGIGGAVVKILREQHWDVTCLSRSVDQIDITNEDSVMDAFTSVKGPFDFTLIATGALEINSPPEKTVRHLLKNNMIEVSTIMKFEDKENSKKKSYFEINFSTIVRVNDEIKEKKDLEKIILCDVQIEIYPDLEKSLIDLLHNCGYPGIKFEKKIDFENLYNQRSN